MKRYAKIILKCIIFVLLLLFALGKINTVLLIKGREGTYYNSYSQAEAFYSLEKNSTDVLLIGSSHSFHNLSPQELYDNYEIRSFNLGSPGQSMIDSYFWLKEALRYQHPKAVVLETYYVFGDYLNEQAHRKAINFMRWSPIKIEAINSICNVNPNISKLSFYLPNIRFHDRWKELTMDDFNEKELAQHVETKGYLPITWSGYCEEYEPYEESASDNLADIPEVNQEYLQKFKDLCSANNISLLLVTVPSMAWPVDRHNALKAFADENNILYFDYNLVENYNRLDNYNYAIDGSDINGHANIDGAIKQTDLLGHILSEKMGIIGQEDLQWESTREYNKWIQKCYYLRNIVDINEYLDAINDPRFSVFITVKGDSNFVLAPETTERLKNLGCQSINSKTFQTEYIAIIDKGKVLYENSGENISINGSIKNGTVLYEIKSAGHDTGNISSIIICDVKGANEYSKDQQGLNIVVYDSYNMVVIDSVAFDTSESLNAER